MQEIKLIQDHDFFGLDPNLCSLYFDHQDICKPYFERLAYDDEYRKISRGEVDIVIGARSAVFAPLKNIGTIIIDEEHSQSYKQESHPKYSAIDVAIERSKYHNAKVILGSATPDLNTFYKSNNNISSETELDEASENPITFPPNSIIAASKLNLVLVLGSKNKVANFLCLHFSQ